MALPFSTTPEIGARGALTSGGGGSSAILTFVGAATTVPTPGPAGIGAAAFESLVPTTVVTPLRTGGTSLALADTSFGTSSVRVTSAISSLRTSTFWSTLTGLVS